MEKNQKIIKIDLIEFSSSSIDDEELKDQYINVVELSKKKNPFNTQRNP